MELKEQIVWSSGGRWCEGTGGAIVGWALVRLKGEGRSWRERERERSGKKYDLIGRRSGEIEGSTGGMRPGEREG